MIKGTPNTQFKLFYSGSELKSMVNLSGDRRQSKDGNSRETMDQMWSRKSTEASEPAMHKDYQINWEGGKGVRSTVNETPNSTHGAGIKDSIASKGYDGSPVTVLHQKQGTRLDDGHHSVKAAADLESEGQETFVPALH